MNARPQRDGKSLPDIHDGTPPRELAVDDAGVHGVRHSLVLEHGTPAIATIDASCSLSHSAVGAHMSRFHQAIDAGSRTPQSLVAHARRIAEEVRSRQQAERSQATLRTTILVRENAPVSGWSSEEPVELVARAVASAAGVRSALTVQVAGMNACPCAQQLVRSVSAAALTADGFSEEETERILSIVPGATHNQRGISTLTIGTSAEADVALMIRTARTAMSSAVHELLKREDELQVVAQAHSTPRFVEDSVRELLAGAAQIPDLDSGDLVVASVRNLESIHAHDVVARRSATVGAIRDELAGQRPHSHATVTLDQWLNGAATGARR